jgi:hypothetical protein
MWGLCKKNYVNAVDHVPKVVLSGETPVGRDIDLIRDLRILFQLRQAGFDVVGKGISHCNQLDIRISHQGFSGGSGSPSPTANKSDAQEIVSRRIGAPRQKGTGSGSCYRGLQETSA